MVLAVADGATTPNPGVVNALALSSTTGAMMRWTGTKWTPLLAAAPSFASVVKFGGE